MNHNQTPLVLTLALILLALGAGPVLSAPPAGGFETVLPHYEAVRKALVADSLKGVAGHAEAIRRQAPKNELGREIAKAAGRLAAAKDLETARGAFYDLSKPMVRWREASGKKDSIVAFCSMAKRSWLQPKGAIGNPYYGKSMATCGEVVSK